MWLCAHECPCLQGPEVSESPRAVGTGSNKPSDVGAGNQTQVF